jgi:oligoendopeptidase F
MTFARHFPLPLAARPFMTGPAFAAVGQGADRQDSLGDLPEWNLADLYPSHDAPEVAADMARAAKDAAAFEARYKGKLAARRPDRAALPRKVDDRARPLEPAFQMRP